MIVVILLFLWTAVVCLWLFMLCGRRLCVCAFVVVVDSDRPTTERDLVTRDLMQFIKKNIPGDAIIAADPVISSMIKLVTRSVCLLKGTVRCVY